jgi:hypothetical protein
LWAASEAVELAWAPGDGKGHRLALDPTASASYGAGWTPIAVTQVARAKFCIGSRCLSWLKTSQCMTVGPLILEKQISATE